MISGKLTKKHMETLGPGRHGDGNGLYLVVDPSGARRWIVRVVVKGQRNRKGGVGVPPVLLDSYRLADCSRLLTLLSSLMGDLQPSAEWRRPGLYQPSMNSKMAIRASALVWSFLRSSNSHSSVAKKLSHIALSYASPTDPMDGRTPASLHRNPKATEVYCDPWSE